MNIASTKGVMGQWAPGTRSCPGTRCPGPIGRYCYRFDHTAGARSFRLGRSSKRQRVAGGVAPASGASAVFAAAQRAATKTNGNLCDVLAHADEGERDTIPVASSVTLSDRQLERVNNRTQSRIEKLRDSKPNDFTARQGRPAVSAVAA